MAFFKNSGRVLRVRPGHLANFSGGAGYMPFTVIFSVPASALFWFVSSLILFLYGKYLLESDDGPLLGLKNGPKTGLHKFVRYAYLHTIICIILATVAGIILFADANRMVYGDKMQYMPLTVFIAVGPLVAWLLSILALVRLMIRRGAGWSNYFIAMAIYVAFMVAGIPLTILLFMVTGA